MGVPPQTAQLFEVFPAPSPLNPLTGWNQQHMRCTQANNPFQDCSFIYMDFLFTVEQRNLSKRRRIR